MTFTGKIYPLSIAVVALAASVTLSACSGGSSGTASGSSAGHYELTTSHASGTSPSGPNLPLIPTTTPPMSASPTRTGPQPVVVWSVLQARTRYVAAVTPLNDAADRIIALDKKQNAPVSEYIPLFQKHSAASLTFARWLAANKNKFPVAARPYVEPLVQTVINDAGISKQEAQCATFDCMNAITANYHPNSNSANRLRIALGLPAAK